MADGLSPWIKFLLGLIPLSMGAIILGALVGFVPTGDGQFLAPAWVIASIGAGLVLFAVTVWIPSSSPRVVRSVLGLLLLVLVAVVCNWTAFATGVRYTGEFSLGPISQSSEDPVGGRIVFGVVAIAIDLLFAYSIFRAVRRRLRS